MRIPLGIDAYNGAISGKCFKKNYSHVYYDHSSFSLHCLFRYSVLDVEIKEIVADGGWSRMDYTINWE